MRPFKLNITPKLTEKQRENRLRIARHHEDWSAEGWRRVLWSEEPSFEFHDPPNHNRRVRAVSSSRCASRLQNEASHQKARPGMMSHRAMSQCQWFLRMSQKTVINGEYYRTNIFAEGYLDAINRKAQNGVFFQRSLMADTSRVVFVQDGALPLTAQKSQHWCRKNLPASGGEQCGQRTAQTSTQQKISD